MKTVEELALEYFNSIKMPGIHNISTAYISGYNKAKEWISVKDGLPEEFTPINILFYIDGEHEPFKMSGEYVAGKFILDNDKQDTFNIKVTHWKYID